MPQAIPWVISLFQGAAFGGGLAGAAAGVAANAALAMAVSAAVTNNSKVKEQGGLIDLTLDSAAPRQLVIGKRMVGGVLVDWYLAGSNNVKLYLPVYLSEGPCGQITRVFAGGRVVWNTPLAHGVRTTIPDFRSGGDRLWVTYYDGRVGQTADSVLVGLGQGWTSNNKMTGCAWVLIECQWDSDNMRSPPSLSFEMEGAKLYDRRLDTTAGGSGSQRANNPATWTWTDNPAVALDHFMLGRYLGAVRTMGIGLEADDVPYDRFAAQANVCDEDVDLLAGGTHKRYRANGVISAAEDYASVVTKLCGAMAARPADFGGRFGVIGVESRTPVMTIDDADVIADTQEIYQPKRSWSALVGAVEGRFQDPAQLYQPTDFPRVTDAAWETEDGGEPKVLTLDLEFETNVERAQRLALLKARMERRQATLRGTYPLWTVELERGDWFIRTGARWGDGKTFEVVERIIDPATYTVTIVAQEVDPADSAWDESVAQDGPPAPVDSTDALSAVDVPDITVTDSPIPGEGSVQPAITIGWADTTDPRVTQIEIEVTRVSDGLLMASQTVERTAESVVVQSGIANAVAYIVRARFIAVRLASVWCDAETVTTAADYIVPLAGGAAPGSDLGLSLDQVAELILSVQTQLNETREYLAQFGKIDGVTVGTKVATIITQISTGDAANASAIDVVAAVADGAAAAVVTEAAARTSGDAANASSITSVSSSLTGTQTTVAGQATAISGLTTSVTALNGDVTSLSVSFTSLDAEVGALSSSVDIVAAAQASTDGRVSGYFGVLINAGTGKVTFELMASGGGSPSGIARLEADTVEIVGDVVVDGTLSATKIIDLSIDTGKVANGAITDSYADETDGGLTTTTSWQDAETVSVPVASGQEVDLMWSFAASAVAGRSSGATGSTLQVRLVRDSTEIYGETTVAEIITTEDLVSLEPSGGGGGGAVLYDLLTGRNAWAHPAGMDIDIPSAGTYSYKLQVKHTGSAPAWTVSNRRLRAVLRKK